MATHSSVLAWRIPGTREPGGLPSMGAQRVRHDRSDFTATAAAAAAAVAYVYHHGTITTTIRITNISIKKNLIKLNV